MAITKYTVTNNAIRIVELALSIVGGHGLSRNFALERYFRDVQCGLYNPPQDDMVLTNLAQAATARQRARPAQSAAPAQPANWPAEVNTPQPKRQAQALAA